MCVIMLAKETRPTEEMVRKAWDHNGHGAGIAWREGRGERKEVVWKKGIMNLDEIKELVAKTPLPFVVHFRVASIGGIKPSLTHPFAIGVDAKLELEGRTKDGVLFHNGHWSDWQDRALLAAINSNNRVPEGSDWSDTRAMAFMVSIYGPDVLQFLPRQKGIVMYPDRFCIATGEGWEKINDVWCSNDYFWHRSKGYSNNSNSYRKMCNRGSCTNIPMHGKDICWQCDKKDEESKKIAAESNGGGSNTNSSVGQSPSVVEVVTGGGPRPLAKSFTLAEVQGYVRVGLVSKSKLKKYQKALSDSQEKGNRAQRGQAKLRKLSEEIAEKLIAGTTH